MDWKTLLSEKGVLMADGAWGTELAQKGLEAGVCPESWNLDHPQEVKSIPVAYAEAGAQIVLTNTFGGSRFKLDKCGLGDRTVEINRIGARLSKEAAGDHALVFASVGPTSEFVEPLGTVTESEMIRTFTEQIQGLLEGGIDGIVIETMTDLTEAQCALKAAQECSDLPVVVSMTFDKGVAGFATMMGITPERAASELEVAGADIIGSNCGSGIENMVEVARLMRSATARPLWIKSNAGTPELVEGKTVFRDTPQHMADHVPLLVEAGANIIGGCCGTTPEHIRVMAEAIPKVMSQAKSNLEAVQFKADSIA